MTSTTDVVVIGAGQSGLSAAHALQACGIRPVVLEAGDRAAGSWPCYYDSLKAFSPAGFNAMPGMPFPGDPDRYPARDEVAGYLGNYAAALGVEIRAGRGHRGCAAPPPVHPAADRREGRASLAAPDRVRLAARRMAEQDRRREPDHRQRGLPADPRRRVARRPADVRRPGRRPHRLEPAPTRAGRRGHPGHRLPPQPSATSATSALWARAAHHCTPAGFQPPTWGWSTSAWNTSAPSLRTLSVGSAPTPPPSSPRWWRGSATPHAPSALPPRRYTPGPPPRRRKDRWAARPVS